MADKKRDKSRKAGLKMVKEGISDMISNSGTKTTYSGKDAKGNTVTGTKVERSGEQKLARIKGLGKAVKGAAQVLFNHPDWYTNYKESDLVNINLSEVRGMPNLNYVAGNGGGTAIPTVASIVIQPTYPGHDNNGWQDGVRRLFTSLRQANRSSVPYNMYDVEKYVLAVRALHVAYMYAKRAYGATNTFKTLDRAIPTQLLCAMGLDPNSFAAHMADLRMLGTRLGSIIATNAPLHIPLFERARWMFSNIFADSNDAKPNYYLFSLAGREWNTDHGARLGQGLDTFTLNIDGTYNFDRITINEAIGVSTSTSFGFDYDTFASKINTLFNNFTGNSIFADISGDILNAFGSDAVYKAEVWESDYTCPIIYDEAALTQIQNSKTLSIKNSADDTTVTEVYTQTLQSTMPRYGFMSDVAQADCAAVASWPSNTIPDVVKNTISQEYDSDIFVNYYKDNITAGEVMSATRLKPSRASNIAVTNNLLTVAYTNIQTETPIIYYVFRTVDVFPVVTNPYKVFAKSATSVAIAFLGSSMSDSNIAINVMSFAETAALLSSFDYHPSLRYAFKVDDGGAEVFPGVPFFDFNVYGRITYKEMRMYNSIADMSLLYTPFLAKSTKVETITFGDA